MENTGKDVASQLIGAKRVSPRRRKKTVLQGNLIVLVRKKLRDKYDRND
jgi:hypothetical protein